MTPARERSSQRLVVGVARVLIRRFGSNHGANPKPSNSTFDYQQFLVRRTKDTSGWYKNTSQGCSNPTNIFTATLVNGLVWAASTQPIRALSERRARGRRRDAYLDSDDQGSDRTISEQNLSLFDDSRASRVLNALANVRRFLTLSLYFTPLTLLSVPCMVFNLRRDLWVRLLRLTLSTSGPAFIKWGQWAATRHDMFPPDVCQELQKLHADAPAHGMSHTQAEILDSFGFPLTDLFDGFDTHPVASGSIGQIYRGELSGVGARLTGLQQGTVVAVKVRHPGVIEAIQRDFELIKAIVHVLSNHWLSPLRGNGSMVLLKDSLAQFAGPLREQVDLSREGSYLQMFRRNFRKEKNVRFPSPLFPLVSPSVLVETFEPGEHISAYVEGRGSRGDVYNEQLARLGARTMLRMLIVDNLVHSDLHPGNILVDFKARWGWLGAWLVDTMERIGPGDTADGATDNMANKYLMQPTVTLIDAGMCTRLSKEDQVNMVGLFESFSRLDGEDIASWTLAFAGDEQTCDDPEAFKEDVRASFDALKRSELFSKGNTDNGAEALASVLEKVRVHHVSLPGHIAAVVVTTLVLEGWSHQLDPAHSTLSEVRRIIKMKQGATRLRNVAEWVQSVLLNEREILSGIDAQWDIVLDKHRHKRPAHSFHG